MDYSGDAVPLAELLDERRHLLDVACRMVGTGSAAEGIVDETYRRWYALSDTARAEVATPLSWLATTTGDICLARLGGPAGPGRGESAGPETWRAAFSHNDAFGKAPGAITDTTGRTAPEGVAFAGGAGRARRWLWTWRSRPGTPTRHDALACAVREACAAEDATLLASLLCPDATAVFDGGGKVRALVRPVHGSEQVARSLLTLLARRPRTTLGAQSVNGRTGLVVRCDHEVAAVISLDIAGDRVRRIWVVLNPDKLRLWNRSPAP